MDGDRAGVASALLNSAQQIGVALGLAVLAGVAAAVTGARAQPSASVALVEGYGSALLVAGGVLIASAMTAAMLLSDRVRSSKLARA